MKADLRDNMCDHMWPNHKLKHVRKPRQRTANAPEYRASQAEASELKSRNRGPKIMILSSPGPEVRATKGDAACAITHIRALRFGCIWPPMLPADPPPPRKETHAGGQSFLLLFPKCPTHETHEMVVGRKRTHTHQIQHVGQRPSMQRTCGGGHCRAWCWCVCVARGGDLEIPPCCRFKLGPETLKC